MKIAHRASTEAGAKQTKTTNEGRTEIWDSNIVGLSESLVGYKLVKFHLVLLTADTLHSKHLECIASFNNYFLSLDSVNAL